MAGAGLCVARWEQIGTLTPVFEPKGHRDIEVDAPDVVARDRWSRATAPMIHPDLLDSNAVRLWLTLAHYHQHPPDRYEIGRVADRRRRAHWRSLLPRSEAAPKPGVKSV